MLKLTRPQQSPHPVFSKGSTNYHRVSISTEPYTSKLVAVQNELIEFTY